MKSIKRSGLILSLKSKRSAVHRFNPGSLCKEFVSSSCVGFLGGLWLPSAAHTRARQGLIRCSELTTDINVLDGGFWYLLKLYHSPDNCSRSHTRKKLTASVPLDVLSPMQST